MRLPFQLTNNKIEEDARVKFIYTSPELHQNIEISLDGENTSIEAIMEAFHRFISALGISIPHNVTVGFIEIEEEDEDEDEDEDGQDESQDEEDDNGSKGNEKE